MCIPSKGSGSDALSADILPVMSQFSQQYNKMLELDLDEVDVTAAMAGVVNSEREGCLWKVEAYIGSPLFY